MTSVELDPHLAAAAEAAVRSVHQRANVVVGDGRDGWQSDAPYDGIVATASSLEVPRAFLDQLREGGVLVLPLRLTDALPFRQIVVTFERLGRRLRSTHVILGGFMRLRDRPDDPSAPWPEAKVVENGNEGEKTVASLSGSTLRSLSAGARRRLLELLLSRPRSRDLGIRVSGWRQSDLETFVTLAAPENRLVGCTRVDVETLIRLGTALPALVDIDGGGIAYLAGAKSLTRVNAHGSGGPELALAELVERWVRRGRPGVSELRVEIAYAPPRTPHWRTARRGRSYVSFDWNDRRSSD